MFQAAYTYSRTIDNSTADFFSTSLTPRRPQDFQDWDAERSVSPLSRTHRFTLAAVYDLPYFKHGNWLMRNIVGNWGFSPVYTYESPQWATVQSATDSNLNGDSAGDRAVFNSKGVAGDRQCAVTPSAQHRRRTGGLSCQQSQCPVHRRGRGCFGDQWSQHPGNTTDQRFLTRHL